MRTAIAAILALVSTVASAEGLALPTEDGGLILPSATDSGDDLGAIDQCGLVEWPSLGRELCLCLQILPGSVERLECYDRLAVARRC